MPAIINTNNIFFLLFTYHLPSSKYVIQMSISGSQQIYEVERLMSLNVIPFLLLQVTNWL